MSDKVTCGLILRDLAFAFTTKPQYLSFFLQHFIYKHLIA